MQKQYPFGEWARKSLVMEVYSNYLAGSYVETSTAADRFNTLYPNSPDAAYVNYLAGQAMYGEMPDVHRDQDRMLKAKKYYPERWSINIRSRNMRRGCALQDPGRRDQIAGP